MASPAWGARQKEVDELVSEVETSVNRVTQRLFLRGLILIVVLLAGGLVVTLIYHRQTKARPD